MNYSVIPVVILFIMTVTAVVAYQTLIAYYVKFRKPKNSEVYLLNCGLFFIALIMFFVLSGFKIKISVYTLIVASVYGVCVMTSMTFNSLALKVGPYSYTTTIISLSTIITALSGWVFWDEELSVFKIIGLIFMVFCFFFAVDRSKDKNSANIKWFLLCMICLISGAVLGLAQKVHQRSDYKAEFNGFLVVAFSISTVFSLLISLMIKSRENRLTVKDENKNKFNYKLFILICALCGICVAFNNCINLYLVGVVDSAIMFPIVNGMPFVIAVILSFVLFRERLNKRQTAGILLGVISMLFLCLG